MRVHRMLLGIAAFVLAVLLTGCGPSPAYHRGAYGYGYRGPRAGYLYGPGRGAPGAYAPVVVRPRAFVPGPRAIHHAPHGGHHGPR